MKREYPPRVSLLRRRMMLAGCVMLASRALPACAQAASLAAIPELDAYLAGRKPEFGRLLLDLPRLADDGNAVAMRLSMPGPFASGQHVASIALFSEKNPVPKMAQFNFPAPPAK